MKAPLVSYLNTPMILWKIPFLGSFLSGSCFGWLVSAADVGVEGCPAACRAARRDAESGVATPSPPLPEKVGAVFLAAGASGGGVAVSHPATVVIPGRPPCSGQASTGSVPAMYTSA